MLWGARYRPAHAGPLPGWERLAFGLVFGLMTAIVVAVSVQAVRAGA